MWPSQSRSGAGDPGRRAVLAVLPVVRPGGQSVNTSDSRVELSYDLAASDALGPVLKERALRALDGRLVDGVLTITASEFRSQLRNREAAARRLGGVLTAATAPPPKARRPTKPTRGSQERRLAAKQRRSQIKRLRRSTERTRPEHQRGYFVVAGDPFLTALPATTGSFFSGEALPGGLPGHVQRRADLGPGRPL